MARGTTRLQVRPARRTVLLACLGLALAAGIARSTATPVPSFAAKKSYATGADFATLVGSADLNGDGSPDLATLESRRLSVFRNRGDGTFLPRSDYQTGPAPDATALADLNGDGRLDLVTANRESGTVSAQLNRGDGSFGVRHDFNAGPGRSIGELPTLAIADVNADGKPDLVVAHGNVVSVLLGNGEGSFQPKLDHGGTGKEVTAVAVADLNGDSKPDLIAVAPVSLLVYIGNGDGTFEAPHVYAGAWSELAVADLNGDGRADVVTWADFCCVPVDVLLNRGDGSFGRPRAYVDEASILRRFGVTGGGAVSAQTADLNGDGKLDLVTIDDGADGDGIGFSVLLNRGDGTFGSRRDFRVAAAGCTGCGLQSLAVGDLNGDGRPDLALTDSVLDSVAVFLNKGGDSFQARRDYPSGFLSGDIAIADLNGDGRADVVTAVDHAVSVLLDRPGRCNVQEVVGMKAAAARWALGRVNCRASIRRVFDPKGRWPRGGLVYSQRLVFGAVLPAGATVRLVVRFGRRG